MPFVIGGQTPPAVNPTTMSTLTWPSYLDLEEVADHLQFDVTPVGRDARKLQRIIDAACTQAQGPDGANRPLAPTRLQERHDGWSGEYIQLRCWPFLQLISCTEFQSSGGPITLTEATPATGGEGIQIDYATSRIMRTFAGVWPKPFFPGSRNIEVVYVAGFNPLPPDLWMATMELVEYWYRNTQQSTRTSAFADQEWDPKDALWPGVPNRVANVFQGYRPVMVG